MATRPMAPASPRRRSARRSRRRTKRWTSRHRTRASRRSGDVFSLDSPGPVVGCAAPGGSRIRDAAPRRCTADMRSIGTARPDERGAPERRVSPLRLHRPLPPPASFAVAPRLEAASCGGARPCKCGDQVTSNYLLGGDLGPCSGHGLVVKSNVVLDCRGFQITGLGGASEQYGISLSGKPGAEISGATVKGCRVSRFHRGIRLRAASSNLISGNTASDNGDQDDPRRLWDRRLRRIAQQRAREQSRARQCRRGDPHRHGQPQESVHGQYQHRQPPGESLPAQRRRQRVRPEHLGPGRGQ